MFFLTNGRCLLLNIYWILVLDATLQITLEFLSPQLKIHYVMHWLTTSCTYMCLRLNVNTFKPVSFYCRSLCFCSHYQLLEVCLESLTEIRDFGILFHQNLSYWFYCGQGLFYVLLLVWQHQKCNFNIPARSLINTSAFTYIWILFNAGSDSFISIPDSVSLTYAISFPCFYPYYLYVLLIVL